ncbi:CamS family sex pheromone protein [Allocoprobacillus halotolerans]|uniref:CamS family sex pheromone protein n=1 Tax=Allocoprobacillus halotolerans TaxID=2944914 RepID=A0ABY5HZY4_9FIRM|nr:CamS family sex pheromone protein [Allocoprobacillus halotolerans]UTY38652.1 CamS family sex pheromone protein [Allocoprobacillus halotolerans]
MRKLACALLALLLLVGCRSSKETVEEETTNNTASMDSFDDTYYNIVKFEDSQLREDFYLDYGSTSDFTSVGRGLQILSSQYFSTSDYYMSEGQYLKLALKQEMVARSSDYSLQPAAGTEIGGVQDPTMVQSILEQDFWEKSGDKYTLAGASFVVVLDPRDKTNTRLETPMDDQSILNYGYSCTETLYNIIQSHEDFEKLKDLPVLITIYQATDLTESTVDGHYILKNYCDESYGKNETVDFETVLFTSARAKEIDATTSNEFDIIKANLKEGATEAAGLVGTARYQDGKIQSMVIEAHLNVKTATELMYLSSILADGIDTRFSSEFDIKVLVYSQDELMTVIIKDAGQEVKSSYLY